MAEALPNLNPEGKQKEAISIRKIMETNSVVTGQISDKLTINIDLLNGIQATLKDTLAFMVERARMEDDRNRFLDARYAEEMAEADRRRTKGGAGSAGDSTEAQQPPAPLDRNIIGMLSGLAALSKLYGFDEFIRAPAYFKMFGRQLKGALDAIKNFGTRLITPLLNWFRALPRAFGDVLKKVGTGQFWKGETYKVFGQLGSRIIRAVTDGLAPIINFFKGSQFFGAIGKMFGSIARTGGSVIKAIGNFLRPVGTFLKGVGTVLSKLAWPITIIFGIIDGITGFVQEYARTGSILEGLKGGFVAIVEGFFNTLVELVGGALEWLLGKLGLDNLANYVGDFTGRITESITQVASGIADFIIGLFTFDGARIMSGLDDVFNGVGGFFASVLTAPINAAVAFIQDIFGWSDPDKPPFDFITWVTGLADDAWEWVTGLFTWENPQGQERSLLTIVGDALDKVWEWLGELFDPKRIIRAMLPDPSSPAAVLIPDSLYEYAGVNPETGEVETPAQRNIRDAQENIQASQARLEALEAERQSGSSDMEGAYMGISAIDEELTRARNRRETAPAEADASWYQTSREDYDEQIARLEERRARLQAQVDERNADIDSRIAEERRIQERETRRITSAGSAIQSGQGEPQGTGTEDDPIVLDEILVTPEDTAPAAPRQVTREVLEDYEIDHLREARAAQVAASEADANLAAVEARLGPMQGTGRYDPLGDEIMAYSDADKQAEYETARSAASAARSRVSQLTGGDEEDFYQEIRLRELAAAMGIIPPETRLDATLVGKVPVKINGQDVPLSLLTDYELSQINAARQIRASMSGSTYEPLRRAEGETGATDVSVPENNEYTVEVAPEPVARQLTPPTAEQNATIRDFMSRAASNQNFALMQRTVERARERFGDEYANQLQSDFQVGGADVDAVLEGAPAPAPVPVESQGINDDIAAGIASGGVATPAPAGTAAPAEEPTAVQVPGRISENLVNMVKRLEGFEPTAYWDVRQWSYGYGMRAPGEGATVDEATADRDLRARLQQDYDRVVQYGEEKGYNWNQQQIEALTSFIYNLGPNALAQVTANGTRSNAEIAAAIPKYNKADGQVSQGLVNRRADELAYFNSEPVPGGTGAPTRVASRGTAPGGAPGAPAAGTPAAERQGPLTTQDYGTAMQAGMQAAGNVMQQLGFLGPEFTMPNIDMSGPIGSGDTLDIPDFNIMGQAVNRGSESIAAAREERAAGGNAQIVNAPTENRTNVTNVNNSQTTVMSMTPRSTEPSLLHAIDCGYSTVFG